jgi:hypothetical protein
MRETEHIALQMWARHAMNEALKPSILDMLGPRRPLTRMQKLRRKLSRYGRRVRRAFDVLRGVDD